MSKSRKKAIAIKWNKVNPAPLITAKGEGAVAEYIIKIAQDNGIEIIHDSFLPKLLMQEDLMDFIPFELYEAVAKVLATVYNLNNCEDE